MRVATPCCTCRSTWLWGPCATAGAISTPSFMGPGWRTGALGRARARRCSVVWWRGGEWGGPETGGQRGGGRDEGALRAQGAQGPEVRSRDAGVLDVAHDDDA